MNGQQGNDDNDPQIGRRTKRMALLRRIRENTNNVFVPTDEVPWILANHWLTTTRALTADDPRTPNPPGFKGELYPPQATMLQAMLDMERRPFLTLNATGISEESRTPIMVANRGLIREHFSFGKTVLAMALVCKSRRPRPMPEKVNMAMIPVKSGVNAAFVTNDSTMVTKGCVVSVDKAETEFMPELTCRYSRVLDVTMVVAASAVISQWAENAERFTSLKYFIIENVKSLREFQELYESGRLMAYSMVLVKAGRVTARFTVEGEPAPRPRQTQRSLIGAIGMILEGVSLARLIIDDFDSIKLGSDDCFLPALFTWVISATRRTTTVRASTEEGGTISEMLRNNTSSFPVLGAALDDITYGALSLKCDPLYVAAHINTTTMEFRRIFVKGGQAAAILRDLGVADDVVEMINGDAIGTAAETLGINAKSVGDIISRILQDRKDKYRVAVHIQHLIGYAKEQLSKKDGKEQDGKAISALRAAIKSGSEAAVDDALWDVAGPSYEVTAALKSLGEWAEEQRATFGKTLERMRGNIREKQCQCCMIPFGGEGAACEDGDAQNAFIMNCCQIIVCETCILVKINDKKQQFIERCPNCASYVNPSKDLIRVGKEIALDDALTDEVLIEDDAPLPSVEDRLLPDEAPAQEQAADTAADTVDAIDNPRLKALIQLVTEQTIECIKDEIVPPYIKGLLKGVKTVPWPADRPKKYVVFTTYPESTKNVAEAMTRLGIGFLVLRGRRQDKDEAREIVRTDPSINVLLITAKEQCSGMHIPWASHIVLYHPISDSATESQAAARIQRLGREFSAECVCILNEADAAKLAI